MNIRLYPTLEQAEKDALQSVPIVVIDVLRASSTIVAAIESGAERIIPIADVETASRLVRPADVQRTADSYGVEPVWFPGMGHDLMLDAGWDDVLDTVLAFAADLPAWGTAAVR